MFRYVAFVWNEADPNARLAANRSAGRLSPHWTRALRQNGLLVYYTGSKPGLSRPYPLQQNRGVVLGRLFHGTAPVGAFDAHAGERILVSGGRHLIGEYWGRYVAFLHDPDSGTTKVLRDPSVGLPCLNARHEGVELFFSCMEDILALGVGPFTVHWPYLTARLCYQTLEIPGSGLKEVTRVMGGECVELCQDHKTSSFYWNPLQVAGKNLIEDPAKAAELLHETVRGCVHAWASGQLSLVHTLSGGLDSSIVLACLKDAPGQPDIACVNYHSPGSNSDERTYARQVAEHAGYQLTVRERDLTVRFETLLSAPRSAYPVNCRYYLENSAWEAQFAHDRQATAIFCGEGGDQIFYQARARFAAGDYLHRHGLFGGALFRVALDSARLDRLSVWRVLGDAFRQWISGQRWSITQDIGRSKKLILPQAVAAIAADTRFLHPAFRSPGRATPSGKLWHAYQLVFPAMDFYDPLGFVQEAERVTPLSSQPIAELCLRIPTDVLTTGGWDRAIARRAFRHDLPRQIVMRRTKGGLDEYLKRVVLQNLDFAREFLLSGHLAREGAIDRAKLETALAGNPTRIGADAMELFDCVNLEAWVRRWLAAPAAV